MDNVTRIIDSYVINFVKESSIVFIYIYIYIYICMCVCMCLFVCMCIYVYIYTCVCVGVSDIMCYCSPLLYAIKVSGIGWCSCRSCAI